jgi:purine-nucleoside phosphorylase
MLTPDIDQRLQSALEYLKALSPTPPDLAMVLGSGLGDIAEELSDAQFIPYDSIPGFPVSTVPGHAGRLVMGKWAGKQVVVMQGRFHFYEGYSMQEVTLPIRVFGLWGIRNLILSNAAGGLQATQQIGEVLWIRDHINGLGAHPLIGPHKAAWGARFVDMSQVYRPDWIASALKLCERYQQPASQGVYMAVTGPTYETPAEYRAFRIMGADAVGMSTVPEAIVAHQMGMNCLAFSVISDLGIEGHAVPVSHTEVVEEVRKVAARMRQILKDWVAENL